MDKKTDSRSVFPIRQSTLTQGKRPSEVQLDKRELRRRTEPESPTQSTEEKNEEQTVDSAQARIKHNNVPLFKTLRKIGNKLELVKHHYELLIDMQKKHTAPRGLKTRVNPSVSDLPTNLYTKWEEAHTNFTQCLTDILIEHWSRKRDVLKKDYQAAHNTLISNTGKAELEYITSLVSKCRLTKKTELTQRRERKRGTDASEEDQNTNQDQTSSTSQAQSSK